MFLVRNKANLEVNRAGRVQFVFHYFLRAVVGVNRDQLTQSRYWCGLIDKAEFITPKQMNGIIACTIAIILPSILLIPIT